MIYLTRQEQRIVILLAVVMLLGVGLLLVKRFQPGWVMRLSLGEPDFDTAKDELSPRLKSSGSMQKKEPEESDTDAAPTSVNGQKQEIQQEKGNGNDAPKSIQPSTQKPPFDQPNVSQETDVTPSININTATGEELETLTGIGPVLAQRIIDYREKNGNFKNIREITAVYGIGDAILQKFRDRISVEDRDSSE